MDCFIIQLQPVYAMSKLPVIKKTAAFSIHPKIKGATQVPRKE